MKKPIKYLNKLKKVFGKMSGAYSDKCQKSFDDTSKRLEKSWKNKDIKTNF